MYELFEERYEADNSVIRFYSFEYVKRTYLRDLETVKNYYHNRVFTIRNTHILIRLLRNLSIPYSYEPERFVQVTEARAPYIANALKITSPLSPGKFFDGEFYGPGCPELILYDHEYFNPDDVERNWKNVAAVKVLLHPRSDMSFWLPDGTNQSTDKGLAVISVDIPLLIYQYRCFTMDQAGAVARGESLLGPDHFVHMYVLPNMMDSHLDITIMNRAMNIYYGRPMGEGLRRLPFPVHDYTGRLDNVLNDVVEIVQRKKMRYEWLLKSIPAMVSTDMQEALIMPDYPRTRQIWWALMLSRLDIMKFLIDIGGEDDIRMNKDHINILKRMLTRLLRDNSFGQYMSRDMEYDTKEIVDAILST